MAPAGRRACVSQAWREVFLSSIRRQQRRNCLAGGRLVEMREGAPHIPREGPSPPPTEGRTGEGNFEDVTSRLRGRQGGSPISTALRVPPTPSDRAPCDGVGAGHYISILEIRPHTLAAVHTASQPASAGPPRDAVRHVTPNARHHDRCRKYQLIILFLLLSFSHDPGIISSKTHPRFSSGA